MEKDLYKAKYLQEPISMLSEENLELLEKHCIKNRKQDIGRRFREHEIVFELIQAYKEQQAEMKKKDKIIDGMAEYLASIDFDEHCLEVPGYCICCPKEDDLDGYMQCIKQYFERKADDIK